MEGGGWRPLKAVLISASAIVAVVVMASAPSAATPVASTTAGLSSCNGMFKGTPPGSLVEISSAGPDGSVVSPGQIITVTMTWNPADFGGVAPDRTDDCVEIGPQVSMSLSQEHKPGPRSGIDTYTDSVPRGGTGGLPVCIRAAVSGPGHSGEKSNLLCYTILDAATPEVPRVILLPAAGALVAATGLVLRRRRRTRARASLP